MFLFLTIHIVKIWQELDPSSSSYEGFSDATLSTVNAKFRSIFVHLLR